MLRKRTRSHQKDQKMGQLGSDVVSESQFLPNFVGQKHKAGSFLNVPGLFVGLNFKASESDSVRSPTSPLDFRVFSSLGNPFRFPKVSNEGHQKSWNCSKVGLSIIDSLDDDPKQSGKVLQSSDSKNILFGTKMRIKTPNLGCGINCFGGPKSLPKSCAVFPLPHAKPSNLQKGNSGVLFEIGEAPSEPNSCEKFQACSLDSARSGRSYLFNLENNKTKLSSEIFCSENGTVPENSPSQFAGGSPKLSCSLGKKLDSVPVTVGSGNNFIGSLSASEIELSEDYTCVRTHGPNAKTTHIFGDCILERHNNEYTIFPKKEVREIELPEAGKNFEVPTSYPSDVFLSFCYSCKKKLEGKDIYMYRGEKAFCSWSCRSEEISMEEAMEKSNDIASSLESSSCEEHLETSMFFAT